MKVFSILGLMVFVVKEIFISCFKIIILMLRRKIRTRNFVFKTDLKGGKVYLLAHLITLTPGTIAFNIDCGVISISTVMDDGENGVRELERRLKML